MNDIINQLMKADKDAQEMALEAVAESAKKKDSLNAQKEIMRNEYYARAEKRINLLEKTRNQQSEQKSVEVLKRFEKQMEQMDKQYSERKETWVEQIFNNVIVHD